MGAVDGDALAIQPLCPFSFGNNANLAGFICKGAEGNAALRAKPQNTNRFDIQSNHTFNSASRKNCPMAVIP